MIAARPMPWILLTLIAAGGCASAPAATPAVPAASGPDAPPAALHWARSSAEHRALFLQVYRDAAAHVGEVAPTLERGAWAVILDADETVLDNSTYQKRLAERGTRFDVATWNAWVREEDAGALPGAAEFIGLVRNLGGRVAIVTNRDEEVCEPTRRNLRALGITVDVVLCQQPGESGKMGRFQSVQAGTTPVSLPPLNVVAWVGDNIQDFPGMDQAARDADESRLRPFGATWFILPNPMYGSWERNPAR